MDFENLKKQGKVGILLKLKQEVETFLLIGQNLTMLLKTIQLKVEVY